jgi:ribosomal protein S12 methylthiotransferase accessory factor
MIDNPYTGLFRVSGRSPREPGDPDVVLWSAAVMPRGPRTSELPAGGAGWTEEAAREAALGEGVERFQPYPLPQDELREGSFDTLGAPAVDPERWVLFHPEQYASPDFPFRPFTRSTRCRWAAFRRVPDGEAVWVPEEMAFLFLDGHRVAPGVSTGLSSGRPGHPVLLRGAQGSSSATPSSAPGGAATRSKSGGGTSTSASTGLICAGASSGWRRPSARTRRS